MASEDAGAHWADMAENTIKTAESMDDGFAQEQLFVIAVGYQQLARRARERAKLERWPDPDVES
jgi:hypothetical protein